MSGTIKPQTSTLKRRSPRGFTLVEILVVIGIIVLLLSILIPVVGRVQRSARVASAQAQLNALAGAIQNYERDYSALPGPLPYGDIRANTAPALTVSGTATAAGFSNTWDGTKITMSENLVLGLLGGLKVIAGTPPTFEYDPALVGSGPNSLNLANPKKGNAYIEQTNLSWRQDPTGKSGQYKDGAGSADDTIIPELVDTFNPPMPILYLRARKGVQPQTTFTPQANSVITHDPGGADARVGQYDTSQYLGYVVADAAGGFIGEGKKIDVNAYKNSPVAPSGGKLPHGLTPPVGDVRMRSMLQAPPAGATYEYPYNAFPYFRDPASPDNNPRARQKDGYILIGAGADRVYGTEDDITSFGSVAQ
ncbi:MAG: prepilin-type N-terminal cleavage/methylation domain-containing protein [Tepidisphaeraceae bacterium]